MDLSSLLVSMLSEDSVKQTSKNTGVSAGDITSVLTEALPMLISGANKQAQSSDTAEGFLNALTDHSQKDASDVSSFIKDVDTDDGSKIINHLLGGSAGTAAATTKIAKDTGVDSKKISSILSTYGPLLMTLLGKQVLGGKKSSKGLDVSSMMAGLLGSAISTDTSKAKTKAKSSKDSGSDLAGTLLKAAAVGVAANAASKKLTPATGASKTKKDDDGLDAGDIAAVASLLGKLLK